MLEVARQASSPSLCASVRAVPWADEAVTTAFQASPFWLQLSADVRIFVAGLPEGAWQGPPNLCLKFEVARQASSPSLCASVQEVPWADEAEQQLSRLAPSACELSAEFLIFGARLKEVSGTEPQIYV